MWSLKKMIDKMTQIFDPENPSKICLFFIIEVS